MFAVIKTGGKQYKVAVGDKLTIEKLEGEDGSSFNFTEILMLGNGADVTVGAPTIVGAGVSAILVKQTRGDKVISFKKRRRQNSKRKRGHRQDLTIVEITGILANGVTTATAVKAPAIKAATPSPTPKVQTAAAIPADKPKTDNLSLISGVGPVYEKKLHGYGIFTFAQIAAWSPEEVTKWDAELSPKGRVTRDEWIEQAKELMAGKAPRAKIDKVELASGKDY